MNVIKTIKNNFNEKIIITLLFLMMFTVIIPYLGKLSLLMIFFSAFFTGLLVNILVLKIYNNKKIFDYFLIFGIIFLCISGFQKVNNTGVVFFIHYLKVIEVIVAGFVFASALFQIENFKVDYFINSESKIFLCKYKYEILLFVIFLIGFAIRLIHFGTGFYEDEFNHLGSAVGFINTGKFVLWDFIKNAPLESYNRAIIVTIQVVAFFKLFGISEQSSRIVPMFWGLISIPISYYFCLFFTKNKNTSLIVAALIAIDPIFFMASTYLRMYSMLIVVFMGFIYFAYRAVERGKIIDIVGTIIFFLISFFVHIVSLVSMLGIVIYILYRFIGEYRINDKISNKFFIMLVSIGSLGIFMILSNIIYVNVFDGADFMLLGFIKYRFNPVYFSLVFDIFPLLSAVIILTIGAYRGIKDRRTIFLLSIAISSIYFFSFWSDRYAGKFYIINMLPLFYIFIAIGLVFMWNQGYMYKIASALFIFAVIANITFWYFSYIKAGQYKIPDYRKAYAYASKMRDKNTKIYIMQPKSYYLKDFPLLKNNYYVFPEQRHVKLHALKKILKNKKVIIIWQSRKAFHIKTEVRGYMLDNIHYNKKALDETGFYIFNN